MNLKKDLFPALRFSSLVCLRDKRFFNSCPENTLRSAAAGFRELAINDTGIVKLFKPSSSLHFRYSYLFIFFHTGLTFLMGSPRINKDLLFLIEKKSQMDQMQDRY